MSDFLFLVSLMLLGLSTIEADKLPFRIIGGETVLIEDFPYQVGIEKYYFHFCGGTILNKKYVVTAGHCFPDVNGSAVVPGLYVRVGADNTNDDGERVEVAKVVKHPKSDYVQYDMAILELKTPLNYSNRVQPVKLPKEGEFLKTGTLVTVTGYGVTNKADYKNTLEMVEVPVMDRDECELYYTGLLKEFMFCAGYKKGGKDSCQGDSGGPAVYNGILFGVVSWGAECAKPESPGVYSNVTYFLPFIKDVTGIKV